MLDLLLIIIIVLPLLCILPFLGKELICHVISKIKGLECLKRGRGIVFMFLFNSQIIYFINVDIVEGWFGIQNSFFDMIFDEKFEVSTPYGKFTRIDYVHDINNYENNGKCYYQIDSVAEYDQYIVVAAKQVGDCYLFVDQQANVTEVSSLTELPVDVQQKDFVEASKYITDLYWRVHHDNHLYVIKILLALALSALVTALEYFLLKGIRALIRKLFRKERVGDD